MQNLLEKSPEVIAAQMEGRPIVALESTIIAHGMPYPENVETALAAQDLVRQHGAVPATIAILDGKLKAGLTIEEIEYVGKMGKAVQKTSRRDIPFVLARKIAGATTVASTMLIAKLAGIEVFATGGIGGVHRNATQTLDISADLQELAQTPVAVVCAGAKSILDLGLTLEYLETHGVTVVGYQTDEFPAFFSRKSGLEVDYRVENVEELAKAWSIKRQLDLKGGMVIANPIPTTYEVAYEPINVAIEEALQQAALQGIKGKAITPFLLGEIKRITQGDSLRANVQLVFNNVRLAAKLAVACQKLMTN